MARSPSEHARPICPVLPLYGKPGQRLVCELADRGRSGDTDHDIHVLGSYLTGLILHQLAVPDLGSDPVGKITALLESLVKAAGTPVRDSAHHDGTEPARSTTS